MYVCSNTEEHGSSNLAQDDEESYVICEYNAIQVWTPEVVVHL